MAKLVIEIDTSETSINISSAYKSEIFQDVNAPQVRFLEDAKPIELQAPLVPPETQAQLFTTLAETHIRMAFGLEIEES